jgi:hypothetical protein
MSETTYAKHYYIADARTPDLDKCWSACNGVDGFGQVEKDEEMNKARKRQGEIIETLPAAPRLILYRKNKSSELMAKLWYSRTIGEDDNLILLLGSLANACFDNGGSTIFSNLHVYLMDCGAGVDRYEISIEVVGEYCAFGNIKADYRRFMTRFDMGHWR